MKRAFYFSTLLFVLFSCEKDKIVTSTNPAGAVIVASSSLVDISSSPLSIDLKNFCYEYFQSYDLKYDTELESVVYEEDMLFPILTLQRYRDSIDHYSDHLAETNSDEVDFRHRMVDYRWSSVSKENSDIVIFVPQLTHPTLTSSQEEQFRNKVIDGFLSWNDAPNSRINISIANFVVEQHDVFVDWINNPSWNLYGQAEFPDGSGKPGFRIRINTGAYAQDINNGVQVLGTTINNNVEATAVHELGHAMGMLHVDSNVGSYAFETEISPSQSVIYAGWNNTDSSPQVSTEDLEALSIIYPDAFPYPTLYVATDYNYLMYSGNYRINMYFVAPQGLSFPKMKVYIKNLQTNQVTKLREASWLSSMSYNIPNGSPGDQYLVSVQTINWRHDVGSGFKRVTVTLP